MSAYRRKQRTDESINVAAEISYPQEALEPDDVTDIIDKLNIGTLRRDQLKVASTQDGSEPEMNDEELEAFYRRGGAKARDPHRIHRNPSMISGSSVGSCASSHSESSAGEAQSSQQSTPDSRRASRQTETQEIGIQTTIGKSSGELAIARQQSESGDVRQKERRQSKSKVKRLFKRRSSAGSNEIEIRIEEEPRLPPLPQGFVVKYMGKRSTKGMWGSKHTRTAVEEVVDAISKMPKNEDLPLVNLDVYYQGLVMRPHSKNKIKSFKAVQVPIQFISYGIQDTVYPRVFCFIMVKEISSQNKSMECHVYACDSSKNARNIAACLAMAFEAYTEHLKGGALRFSVNVQMDNGDDKSSFEV